MASLVGALRISLGLETATFERDIGRAQGKFGKFATGLGIAAGALGGLMAAAGLSDIVGQAFEMGSALSEAAEKAGLTAEGFQKMKFAAEQNGISVETLQSSVAKMNKSVGELLNGSPKAAKAFAAIGLAADDLKGKSPEEQFALIADRLSKIPDASQRAAMGSAIFGKSFAELLPLVNGGAQAIRGYYDEAVKNGIITNQQAKDLDEVADKWDKFKTKALAATAGVIAGLIPYVRSFLDWRDKQIAATQATYKAIGDFATGVTKAIGSMVTSIKNWFYGTLGSVFDWFSSKAKSVRDTWEAIKDKVGLGASKQKASLLTAISAFDDFGDAANDNAGMADSVAVRIQKSFKDMAEGVLGSLQTLSGAVKGGGFLDILSAVVGLGLQLGGIGLFGKNVANRINGVAPAAKPGSFSLPDTGSFQIAGLSRPAANGNGTLTIVPSPLFQVYADQRAAGVVAQASPSIANGTMRQMAYRGTRRLA